MDYQTGHLKSDLMLGEEYLNSAEKTIACDWQEMEYLYGQQYGNNTPQLPDYEIKQTVGF